MFVFNELQYFFAKYETTIFLLFVFNSSPSVESS